MAMSMLLVCVLVGLVSGQMTDESTMMMATDDGTDGITEAGSSATDDMGGQTDATEVPFSTNMATASTTEVCYDVLGQDCFRYKDEQCVGPYETWARQNCSLRCGYCAKKLPCVDKIDYCDQFGDDVCQNELYGQYMRENCRKYCNICRAPTEYLVSSTTTTTTPVPTIPTTPYNPVSEWCQDRLNCWYYPDEKCVGDYEDWARKNCAFRCGYCPGFLPPCVDLDVSCGKFTPGACTNVTFRAYMRINCRKTCNECVYPAQDLEPNKPPVPSHVTVSTTPTAINTPTPGPTGTLPPISPNKPTGGQVPVTTKIVLPTGEDCKDAINCTGYSKESCSGIFKTWALTNCPRTCGYCTASTECRDYEECDKLPTALCTDPSYRKIAETTCRKFCKICTDIIVPTKPSVTGTTEAVMVPTKPSRTESYTADVSMATQQTASEQPSSEPVPSRPSSSTTACKDNPKENCTQYSQKSCQGAFKSWAIRNCPVHCGYCGGKTCNKNFHHVAIPSCCTSLCSCPDVTLTGTVRDATTGNTPMVNVSVYLRDCPCEPLTTSDDNGDYLIKGVCLKEGDVARFEFPGYASFLRDIANPQNDVHFVAVGDMTPLMTTVASGMTSDGGS
ncbi:uncharacterized protein LOC125674517 isoform X2 [Ostrea edulis]|uniref:uncharacterized protein LOC125674517 isoform X2 n=1 Tax=Ostrea edulis TaxID=37623 RepID=UPI0024AE9609|nr:uncharacterized protein LOC125674517 isoform X2 [Ostrea edulis]